MSADTGRMLTPGMRRVLVIVGVLVVLALIIAVWLFTTAGSATNAQGSPALSTSPSQSPTRGPVPGATATTGSEVQAPEPGQTQADPGRLPPIPTPSPLAPAPLPESASASGSLVDGFPAALMGPTATSDVIESSIAAEGTTMQVALVARTDDPQSDVTAYYKGLWEGLGLSVTTSSDGLTAAGAFESFTLAFPSSGTGTVYSVFAVLRTS